jgi:hypothetical protein
MAGWVLSVGGTRTAVDRGGKAPRAFVVGRLLDEIGKEIASVAPFIQNAPADLRWLPGVAPVIPRIIHSIFGALGAPLASIHRYVNIVNVAADSGLAVICPTRVSVAPKGSARCQLGYLSTTAAKAVSPWKPVSWLKRSNAR